MEDVYTPIGGHHVTMPKAPIAWPAHRIYTVQSWTPYAIVLMHDGQSYSLPAESVRAWNLTRMISREQAEKAIIDASYMAYVSEDAGDAASDMVDDALSRLAIPLTWFTYDTISGVLNGAANDASEEDTSAYGENEDTIRAASGRDLAVNAALYLLDHPDADLYDVITTQYAEVDVYFDDLEEGQPEPPKGSEDWNEALYQTVTGWIA